MAEPLGHVSDEALGPGSSNRRAETDYTFTKLPSIRHFRLLKLYKTKFGDPVTCSLHVFEIQTSSCPQFEAISYTWDKFDPFNPCIVLVISEIDGKRTTLGGIPIRRNLSNLLTELSRETHDQYVWLWVDTLCIDQTSSLERSHQVRLMGSIYSRAFSVIAWPESSQNSGDSATNFQHVYRNILARKDMWRPLEKDSEEKPSIDCGNRSIIQHHPIETGDWQRLLAFCQLPYWNRKWIIQEIILARTVVLKCFGRTYLFADLEELALWISKHPEKSNSNLLGSPMIEIALHRHTHRTSHHYPEALYTLLRRYQGNKCSEPPDHVYSLINLVGEHRKHLKISYEQTPAQQYDNTMKFLRDHDHMPPHETLGVAHTLDVLLKRWHDQPRLPLTFGYPGDASLISIMAFDQGEAESLEESESSIIARRVIKSSLQSMPQWTLKRQNTGNWLTRQPAQWALATAAFVSAQVPPRTSIRTMAYFKLSIPDVYGLASVELQDHDRIWYFPGTALAFVVRTKPNREAVLVGRAYLFHMKRGNLHRCRVMTPNREGVVRQYIFVRCEDVLVFARWAMNPGDQRGN